MSIHFSPPYSVTGNPCSLFSTKHDNGGVIRHTVLNTQPIISRCQFRRIIPSSEFAKSRQRGSPHPNHEIFILAQVRDGLLLSISIWKSFTPILRRHNLPWFVFCFLYNFLVTFPSNSLVCHCILHLSIHTPNLPRAVDCIIEHRIRNQSTRIVCFLRVWVNSERLTSAPFDGLVLNSFPFHLIKIHRLHISSVILIEVG